MAIEFRCNQCNKLLRTADDTAGKKAKCPECGTVLGVPASGAPSPGQASSPFVAGEPSSGVDPQNPFASPMGPSLTAPAAPGPVPPSGVYAPTTIDFSDVLGRTWSIFKKEYGMCLAVLVVAVLINFAAGMVGGFIPIVGPLVTQLFSLWITIGMILFFLKTARGQKAELGELFAGGPFYVNILLGQLVIGAIIFAILLVCIVPGIALLAAKEQDAGLIALFVGIAVAITPIAFVSLIFSQFFYLVLDRNLGPIEALKESVRIMNGNKVTLLLIALVLTFVGGALVVCTCGLGYFAVGPYAAILGAVIYLAMTGQPTADQTYPPQ